MDIYSIVSTIFIIIIITIITITLSLAFSFSSSFFIILLIIIITIIDFFIFEISNLYAFDLGFISSLPQFYLRLKALLSLSLLLAV
jgi:hypothetical protein